MPRSQVNTARALMVGVAACTLSVIVTGCAVGSNGASSAPISIQRGYIVDATTAWQKLNTVAYRGKQDDISFVDDKTGWYGNGAGKLYRTTDGGNSWQEQLSKPGTFVRTVGFVDAQRGFMGNVGTDYYPGVTDTNPLYETRDGGVTWSVVPQSRISGPLVKGLCAIDILKKQSIYQGVLQDRTIIHAAGRVGGPGFVMRSLDGGESWKVLDLNQQVGPILDIKFFDENNGLVFAGTDANVEKSNALILQTRDGGATWKKVYQSTRPYENTWKASFPTRKTGYVTVQSYDPDKSASKRVVAKTTDGGNTWSEIPLVDEHAVRQFGIAFADEQTGWVGTSTTGFQTVDGGVTWSRVNMGRAVNKIRLIPTADGLVGYAIGVDVHKLVVAKRK
ncbi:MAG: hypothetical protein ING60_12355 [Rhodocyclaceae bacterium]|nr:hypothetical protein [Rhodocyclaceae bacterium]